MPPVLVHRRSVLVACSTDQHGGAASCREDGPRFVAEVPRAIAERRGWIVENWGQVDNLGLLQQLGVVPPVGEAR